jgi:hypothetical protein
MHPTGVGTWTGDWAWSLPLIVVTVVIHVCGLAIIGESVVKALGESVDRRRFMFKFATAMAVTSLLATILHGIEGGIWAVAYWYLAALPDARTAMLYSISAMTSYGHAALYLKEKWQMMGALEALNGMLLFGLTTAFLFAMIQRLWPLGSREHHRDR